MRKEKPVDPSTASVPSSLSETEGDEPLLCKPCAESMKKGFRTVKDVNYIKPGREKGTCELCQRRRFGYYCEVEFMEVIEI
ncbi:MAG: hypothetical protein IJ349_05400 [Clostridia bacterium]|nr:hypothetical protein [Clostridia bacterium]